jgi:N-acetylglutamate synthase
MVMVLDLSLARVVPSADGVLHRQSLDGWMSSFCRMRGESLDSHQTHRELLGMIPGTRHPVSLFSGGQVVSCGLCVVERSYVGIFDVITHPDHRNMGYGTALICGMLEWAQGQGARHAYLQVMMDNAPAQHVYHRIGFQDLYPYWYRVRA